jgi:hypothetical protein
MMIIFKFQQKALIFFVIFLLTILAGAESPKPESELVSGRLGAIIANLKLQSDRMERKKNNQSKSGSGRAGDSAAFDYTQKLIYAHCSEILEKLTPAIAKLETPPGNSNIDLTSFQTSCEQIRRLDLSLVDATASNDSDAYSTAHLNLSAAAQKLVENLALIYPKHSTPTIQPNGAKGAKNVDATLKAPASSLASDPKKQPHEK